MIPATNIRGAVTAATGSAQAAASTPTPIAWAVVQNDADSAGHLLVGGAAAQTLRLAPGEWETLYVTDLSSIYFIREDAGVAASIRVTYGV